MIARAAGVILGGGVIVYPTETVYGLGASALDLRAVQRVFRIKERPAERPISLAVSSFEMLEGVAEVSAGDLDLLRRLLPGPISVLVRKREIVPDLLTAGSPLVGIRFPDHEIARGIIERTGPITSTSANITGSPPPASLEDISEDITGSVDLVVDGGRCRYAEPSTLLDLSSRKILRPGAGLEVLLREIS